MTHSNIVEIDYSPWLIAQPPKLRIAVFSSRLKQISYARTRGCAGSTSFLLISPNDLNSAVRTLPSLRVGTIFDDVDEGIVVLRDRFEL
jgi:hypothetical protein